MSEDQPLVRRRSFLKIASAVGAAVMGLAAGIPPLTAFLSPLFRKKETEAWVGLGEAEFFDWEVPVRVDIPQTVQDAWVETRVLRSVWVYTEDGETFTVFNGRCTHLSCQYNWDEEPNVKFHPEAEVFHCPCHHAVYKLTGEVIRGPAPRPLDTLEWKIEDGILYAKYQDFRAGIPEKVAL